MNAIFLDRRWAILPVTATLLLLGFYFCYPLIDVPVLEISIAFGNPHIAQSTFDPLSAATVFGLGVTYFIVFLFGYVFLPKSLSQNVSPATAFFASFVFSFPMTIGLMRILSLFFPLDRLYGATVLSMAGLTFCRLRKFSLPKLNKKQGALAIFYGILFLFCLIVTLNPINGHIFTGHGEGYYAYLLRYLDQEKLGTHFPIFTSHYAEILFNFLIYQSPSYNLRPVILYWLTNSIMKLSVFCFLFSLLRFAGLTKTFSLSATLFLFLAPFSPNPFHYRQFFDASNPLSLVMHPGRMVWIVLTLWALCALSKKIPLERKFSVLVPTILLSLSLSAEAFHNFLSASVFLTAALLAQHTFSKKARSYQPTWELFFFLFCLIAPVIAYEWKSLGVSVLLASSLGFSAYFLVQFLFKAELRSLGSAFFGHYAWIIGFVAFAALFLGNLPIRGPLGEWFWDSLHSVGLFSKTTILNLFHEDLFEKPAHIALLGWSDFPHRTEATFSIFGAKHALAHYGLLWVCALVSFVTLQKHAQKGTDSERTQCLYWKTMLGVSMAVFSFAIFIIHFYNNMDNSWIKSRFLEYPTYTVFFIFFLSVSRFWPKPAKALVIALLLFHAFGPLLGGRAEHYQKNAKLLWSALPKGS